MDYVLITKDQSEALAHRGHKYITRKWKNGHWVYQYNKPKNPLGSDEARGHALETSVRAMANKFNFDQARKKYNDAALQYRRRNPQIDKQRKDAKVDMNTHGRNYAASMQEINRLEKAINEYESDPRVRAKKWLKKKADKLKRKSKENKPHKASDVIKVYHYKK